MLAWDALRERVYVHRRPLEITLTLSCEASIHEVEHRAKEVLHRGRVLRINYTGTEQQILMIARPKHHRSLAEISESLRVLDGVNGVDMTR